MSALFAVAMLVQVYAAPPLLVLSLDDLISLMPDRQEEILSHEAPDPAADDEEDASVTCDTGSSCLVEAGQHQRRLAVTRWSCGSDGVCEETTR